MTIDSKSLSRSAQQLVVELRRAKGSPPVYEQDWRPVWGAKVDRIDINKDATPSVATIWFPELRWNQPFDLLWGDMVRIRTNEPQSQNWTILFVGFVTSYLSDFSGGMAPGKAFERNAITCQSFRWLLAITSPIYGQICRSPDDYVGYGTENQAPVDGEYFCAIGRRAIFNADGLPNRDVDFLKFANEDGYGDMPIFADSLRGVYWNARNMVRYILSPLFNKIFDYLPIKDPTGELAGLWHDDWDKELNDISIEGLNVIEALAFVCKNLGWCFREDYKNDGTVTFVFYKAGSASGSYRDYNNPAILHQLHAPKVGDSIDVAVREGRKMLWAMSLAEDIASLVNAPHLLGFPDRFEFTAALVPAWLDDDLEPAENLDDLFFTEAVLQDMDESEKESKTFFKYYHPRGSQFRRDVGRKWTLNESGHYTMAPSWSDYKSYIKGDIVRNESQIYRSKINHVAAANNAPPAADYWQQISHHYDRGEPFKFEDVIPLLNITDETGKRLYGPFKRQLLQCLTVDKDTLHSVGIRVEFSFDGGTTWQIIPASITSLKDEAGIYIEEANLSELVDKNEADIASGDLAGVQLHYWSSLCDDKINNRVFKNNQWLTRVRVTASIQMDMRLSKKNPLNFQVSGSPFHHAQIYDFSARHGLAKRTSSSGFSVTDLPSFDQDSEEWFDKHLQTIREANQDMSVSGQFTLERLWLGDGSGVPEFALGDAIEKITGREYHLIQSFAGRTVYPEIIQIIYLPDRQMMKLITRDLRFAEVALL